MKTRVRREIEVGLGLLVLIAVVSWPPGWFRDPPDDAVPAQAPPPEAVASIARLRADLGAALRGALAQGPEAAVEVCRTEAPRIAAAVAAPGVSLGRTSLRLRNPENAPRDWVVPLLEEYRLEAAEAPSSRTVALASGGTGYVEPIYLKPPCLTCHGNAVSGELLATIRSKYPEDRAIGFEEGDFRGLFWAEVDGTPRTP